MRINPNRKGSALLTVLWLSAALSAIGLAVASNVRGETERAGTNVEDARAYFLARGAIERTTLRMQWGQAFYVKGVPSMDLDFPGGSVHVDIIPETAKLSLNSSLPEEFTRLLMALGVAGNSAVEIAAAMVDWRTPDPLHNSPFDAFYLGQSPSFFARHASFLESEELLLVRGITPDLYYGSSLDRTRAGLRDCVSVYGSTGQIDLNTAQPETLQAIGITPADAAGIVRLRAQRPFTYADIPQITQETGPAGLRLGLGGQTIFTLRATARMRQGEGKLSDMRRTVGALVKFWAAGNLQRKPAGVEVLRWFDRA